MRKLMIINGLTCVALCRDFAIAPLVYYMRTQIQKSVEPKTVFALIDSGKLYA